MALCMLAMTLLGGFLALPTLFAELFIYSQHHDIAVLPPPTDPAAFAPRPTITNTCLSATSAPC